VATVPIDLTDVDIPENTSQRINFTVVDEDGNGIPAASLSTLTVTLYNKRDEAIINSRDGVSILNANGGQVDANGVGSWLMEPDDNPILVTTSRSGWEHHVVLFEWTWGTGKAGKQPVKLKICDLKHVP
jgi:hypothetical protein